MEGLEDEADQVSVGGPAPRCSRPDRCGRRRSGEVGVALERGPQRRGAVAPYPPLDVEIRPVEVRKECVTTITLWCGWLATTFLAQAITPVRDQSSRLSTSQLRPPAEKVRQPLSDFPAS